MSGFSCNHVRSVRLQPDRQLPSRFSVGRALALPSASAPGSTGSANKGSRRGKTRRQHSLLSAMALGPGVVLAEVAGSVFCPRSPSRRLHCLLHRHSRRVTWVSAGPMRSVRLQLSRYVADAVRSVRLQPDRQLPSRFSVAQGFSPAIGVSARKHRFRKQGKSARQNTSPACDVECHGARTRCGPRGGGWLRVLSTVAVAPPSLFAYRHSRPLTQYTPPVQSVVSGFSRTVDCRHDSWYAGCQDSIN